MQTMFSKLKLDNAIQKACYEAYPEDVDNAGFTEDGFEIVKDANDADREIFEEGMRTVIDHPEKYGLASEKGVKEMKEVLEEALQTLRRAGGFVYTTAEIERALNAAKLTF